MKQFIISLILIVFNSQMPSNWSKTGSMPAFYDVETDTQTFNEGKQSVTLKSNKEEIKGFGTLMQNCKTGSFKGKRVKFSAYIKTKDVTSYAGLWFRVDRPNSPQPYSMDNMNDRPIKGNNDWTKYEIVLDVPKDSEVMAYGVLLRGTGQVWLDNSSFQEVDSSISLTGKSLPDVSEKTKPDVKAPQYKNLIEKPENLGFEN